MKITLPDEPIIWIQTTWEGGRHPIKVAPYTKSMLDTYRNNVLACMILSTTETKGKFDIKALKPFNWNKSFGNNSRSSLRQRYLARNNRYNIGNEQEDSLLPSFPLLLDLSQ